MSAPEDDLRVDALSGQPVVVAQHRQHRPSQLDGGACPFCPGGLEAPEPYETRWFVNRWPPMPDDRCEVVLYTPRHDAALWELGEDGVQRVIELWAERTRALGARDDVGYVLPFENRGAAVGATIDHPHGQIYAFAAVPPAALVELGGDDERECAICADDGGERTVHTSGGARAWVPRAASWPYELLIAPVDHLGDLTDAQPAHAAIAAALADALRRLDGLFGAPMPYMAWVHQRPTDGGAWPAAHVHVHVAPLLRAPGTPRFVAAGELGSGVHFNPVAPEAAAATLREVG